MDISIPKFLSSSLIDLDVHPSYVTVIIKAKTLRLVLPAEVNAEEAVAQRSTTTGHLLISMPKIDPTNHILCPKQPATTKKNEIMTTKSSVKKRNALGTEMYDVALKGTVRVDNIVRKSGTEDDQKASLDMRECSTTIKNPKMKQALESTEDSDSSDEPPPLF